MNQHKFYTALFVLLAFPGMLLAKSPKTVPGKKAVQKATITFNSGKSKKISDHLFGIFFEDINYAADGGLYAELVQNRSFEYAPSDHRGWNSFTAWKYTTRGYGYGTISVETGQPISPNNPHYIVLNVQEAGQQGIGIINNGYDGIAVKAGDTYNFSVFMRQMTGHSIPVDIQLRDSKGKVIGKADLSTDSHYWKKYTATLTASEDDDSCSLALLAQTKGKLAIDMVSLFPAKTFKDRVNGLRSDLAQVIANLRPKFMRFPGGCLVHGDGIGNMYRWENTIGPVEQRKSQRDIWGYHQSVGLGYYEYFQFCEDIGAIPVPVVPAAVSCQNSGGTWSLGSTGQRALPMDEMPAYIQEVMDLIEYANGPVTSKWGAKRAAAGHPAPFHLKYLAVGNEDKQTPQFRTRFKMIYDTLKAKHPEITVIGTVGPGAADEDYVKGWKFANELKLPMVDEHYNMNPDWFVNNTHRYDTYNRSHSKENIWEYATHGSKLSNALAEAFYMTSFERNGDVVRMASYAPLLARVGHTQWNPDLIYFNKTEVVPTVNYYVQKLFSTNEGDRYYADKISTSPGNAKALAVSCVKDDKTGDIIIKLVNRDSAAFDSHIKLYTKNRLVKTASCTVLQGAPDAKDTFAHPHRVIPHTSTIVVAKNFTYRTPAHSLTVIRIKTH